MYKTVSIPEEELDKTREILANVGFSVEVDELWRDKDGTDMATITIEG